MVRDIPDLKGIDEATRELLASTSSKRPGWRRQVVTQIRSAPSPRACVQEVLRQCAGGGGPDGLDTGIDLLSEFGPLVLEETEAFIKKDSMRWPNVSSVAPHINDDKCYILLRALARSELTPAQKLPIIQDCALRGTRGIREAAVHALGDLGGQEARIVLERLANEDPDSVVQQSAQETLRDLES